jgi:hypothetical protein
VHARQGLGEGIARLFKPRFFGYKRERAFCGSTNHIQGGVPMISYFWFLGGIALTIVVLIMLKNSTIND